MHTDPIDFAMLDIPAPLRRTAVVAVERGHRLVAATVTWWAHGAVDVDMECLGGLSRDDACKYIRTAVEEAADSRPAVHGLPARGLQISTGRTFARGLALALRDGRARWRRGSERH